MSKDRYQPVQLEVSHCNITPNSLTYSSFRHRFLYTIYSFNLLFTVIPLYKISILLIWSSVFTDFTAPSNWWHDPCYFGHCKYNLSLCPKYVYMYTTKYNKWVWKISYRIKVESQLKLTAMATFNLFHDRILSVALTDLNYYKYNIFTNIYVIAWKQAIWLATCIAPLKLIPVSIAT